MNTYSQLSILKIDILIFETLVVAGTRTWDFPMTKSYTLLMNEQMLY